MLGYAMICDAALCYAMLCSAMLKLSAAKTTLRRDTQREAKGTSLGEPRGGDWGNRPGRAPLPGPLSLI
eukprot:2646163-Pyramimonas_sp.AAC.1